MLPSSKNELGACIVRHFKHVIDNEIDIDAEILQQIAFETYEYLMSCRIETLQLYSLDEWVWVESCSTFVRADMCALNKNCLFKNNLEPFIYVLPKKMSRYEKLLCNSGVEKEVTDQQIIAVLECIKNRSSEINADEAWSLVKSILDWIVEREYECDDILVPIESQDSFPDLYHANDVSYTDNQMLLEIADTLDDEYILIHHSITHLASKLGLTPLSDQLDITEEVFQDAGQHEPLTTRLNNILKEYKDGLTIIKEMIQNADDAEATEVNILYDSRQHTTERLLFKGIAGSHGPALVVHNNAKFTEEDFVNITKLAGATKKDKPLKIGKFGIGFCSVYHITDVPSFVSGDWLYIFDPTLSHLKGVVKNENQPGKKVKYMSKFIAQTKQLAPYKNLFDFDPNQPYDGTMFRFPFRRHASQISSTVYNEKMINQLKKQLVENGKNMLLFLSHVKKISFHSVSADNTVSQEIVIKKIECFQENVINIQTVNLPVSVNPVNEHWLICKQTDRIYNRHESNFQLAVASVACQLSEQSGQYKVIPVNGLVFCYLPLSVPSTGLPVHINANFAVMSNRSGIWTSITSGPSDLRELWNQQLMETVISTAYCNLLLMFQIFHKQHKLVDYEFFTLFPLTACLSVQHPWTKMIKCLYSIVLTKNLLHSKFLDKWLNLEDSQFLTQTILSFHSGTIPICVIDSLHIMKLSVIDLPQQYVAQIQSSTNSDLDMLNQTKFCQTFISMVSSFSHDHKLRNEVLSKIFLAAASEIANTRNSILTDMLKNHSCIPCTPNGKELKLASELVDPKSDLSELFDKENTMFPISLFSERRPIYKLMKDMGLLTSHLPWSIVLSCAKSIQAVYERDKQSALKRVSILIKTMNENLNKKDSAQKKQDIAAIDALKKVQFVPVAPQPNDYILSWKGGNITLSSPCKMFYPTPFNPFTYSKGKQNIKRECCLLGSQKIIVNSLQLIEGGCGSIPHPVLNILEFETLPSVDSVLANYQCLIEQYQQQEEYAEEKIDNIETICRMTFEFLNNELEKQLQVGQSQQVRKSSSRFGIGSLKAPCATELLLSDFHEKPFIWTGNCFTTPENIARRWREKGPFLYEIPSMLSERKLLIDALCIKEKFSINKLLDTLNDMYNNFGENPLPEKYHRVIDAIISEMNTFADGSNDFENMHEIILPSTSYSLCSSNNLSFNDSAWLPVDDDCVLVHSTLGRKVALQLGVKAIRSKFLEKYITSDMQFGGLPFGQKEDLTQRIKNIIRDYPCDATLIKELLQNADDAKAKKMCIILDKRMHGTERLPSKEWSSLQGPALLVWNNKEFTENDLEGIQKLGLGSKRDDFESIGQFGIGFNVVYHLTDCPSLISGGKTLCVFDPHCRYIPQSTTHANPGRRYDGLENVFWTAMSDLKNAYLQADPIDNQPPGLSEGSLFRFPLRYTKAHIMESEILEDKINTSPLSGKNLEEKLDEWVVQIKDALVFLNHITEFSYYVIEGKQFDLKVQYKVTMEASAVTNRDNFFRALQKFKECKRPDVFNYRICMDCSQCSHIQAPASSNQRSRKWQEEWYIQQGVGDLEKGVSSQKWRYIKQILPKHGIAVPINVMPSFRGKIFCFLPLPGNSGLPVHINGQFVLSSNRHSLWIGEIDGIDEKKEWNDLLLEAIASSYVHFLTEASNIFVKDDHYNDREHFYGCINQYYGLYPFWNYPKSKAHEQLDSNCLKMAQIMFQKLWVANSNILATEVFSKDKEQKSLVKANWNCLKDEEESFNQVYFQPDKERKDVIPILRLIKLKMTCAPNILYQHLLSDDTKPIIATKESVFTFYCRFHQLIFMHTCSPCPIDKSPFKTEDNFYKFIKYLLVSDTGANLFPKPPFGYPLLLTADGFIRCFDNENFKPMLTIFVNLFPKSLSAFIHPVLFSLTLSSQYYIVSSEIDFKIINKLLEDNFSLELKQEKCNNSEHCLIEADKFKKLWECLLCDKDKFLQTHFQKILQSWALIPAKNGFMYSAVSAVVPVVSEFGVEKKTFDILTKVGLPVLDLSSLPTIAITHCLKTFPTMQNYDRILSMLYYLHQEGKVLKNLSPDDSSAGNLLTYFSKTTFLNNEFVKNMIMSLPLFKSIEGNLSSLSNKKVYLWPERKFCDAGYNNWAPCKSVVFLETLGDWRCLTKHFDTIGSILNERQIYLQLILPKFQFLSSVERIKHLQYIRDNIYPITKHEISYTKLNYSNENTKEAERFLETLKTIECIKCPKTNELKTVSKFSDHTVQILTLFPDHFIFLPDEYRDDKWMEFLRDLGLSVTVDVQDFIDFCRKVESQKHNNPMEASIVLLHYLFDYGTNWNKYYLLEIAKICFVLVADLSHLSWIKAPCSPSLVLQSTGIGLTRLNEAVIFEYASLIWTVKPVIKLPSRCMQQPSKDEFLEVLQVTITPKPEDVLRNIINVSKSNLTNFELFSKYDPHYIYDPNASPARIHVIDIFVKTVSCLQKHSKSLISVLKDYPCIPVSADTSHDKPNKIVLVKPITVVTQFGQFGKSLIPYINEVPACFRYVIKHEIFEEMGISNTVGLVNIQHLFETLYRNIGNEVIDPNQLNVIRSGVIKLSEITSNKDCVKKPAKSLIPLYLPTKTGNHWSLRNSKELFFADSSRFNQKDLKDFNFVNTKYSLFYIPPDPSPQSEPFRSQFHPFNYSVEPNTLHLRDDVFCHSLPIEVRPLRLSLYTEEKRLLVGNESNDNNIVKASILEMLKFREHLKEIFVKMIDRCLPDCEVSEDIISNIMLLLKDLKVIVICGLQASVHMDGNEIGSLTSPKFILEKSECYTLYLSDSARPENDFWLELSQSLLMELAKILHRELTEFFVLIQPLKKCLQIQSYSSLQLLAKQYNVQMGSLQNEDLENGNYDEFSPKLGKKLPEQFICRLDRSIDNIYRPQEWVGYEVAEQNFVWAIVIHPMNVVDVDNPMKEYKILVSNDYKDGKVVSALDLYKIMPIDHIVELSETQEIVLLNKDNAAASVSKVKDAINVKDLKKKVYEELKMVLKLASESEKKKAIRRMYIKYHPDKAKPEDQEVYEEVFKFLRQQLDQLEKGLPLQDPDDKENEPFAATFNYAPSTSWSSFFMHWDGHVPRRSGWTRGESWRGRRASGKDDFTSFQSKPSPQEAKRWLKQAHADNKAMRSLKAAMNTERYCFACHVIFLAHEVVEKSLKAGMYALVGLNPDSVVNHQLRCHAESICSQRPEGYSIGEENISLAYIADKISPYFEKSRYPNNHQQFLAPVDVYTQEDAEKAAEYAEMVIRFITSIVIAD